MDLMSNKNPIKCVEGDRVQVLLVNTPDSRPTPAPLSVLAEPLYYLQPLPPPAIYSWFVPHPLPSLFPPTVQPEPWSYPHPPPPPPPPPPPTVPPEPQVGDLYVPMPTDKEMKTIVPVATLNGEMVYGLPPVAPPTDHSAAVPLKYSPKKQQQVDEQPYIKKPPNAFMLFLKEQRPNVVAGLKITNNAEINTELGQRWRSMPMSEKDRYFSEAENLRRLHELQFPKWSTRDNYGKKRRRIRRKDPMPCKDEGYPGGPLPVSTTGRLLNKN